MNKIRKSVCCNAEIDCRGGGYEGEYIHPIEDYCKNCNQTLAINGIKAIIHNPETGEVIKNSK